MIDTVAGFSARERLDLAERESDGVAVTLYWTRETGVVVVAVDDATTGDFFEIVVENERPLDVFYHPFAYAHARGIELESEAAPASPSMPLFGSRDSG